MTRALVWWFAGLLLAATMSVWQSGWAADAAGQFAVKGAGLQSCRQFVSAQASRSRDMVRFRSWLEGYLSAVNRYEPQTYDSTPWGSTGVYSAIFEGHCRNNPNERFVDAVQKLVITLKPDRLYSRSPMMTVRAGGRSTQIYQEVLRRVQTKLAERGLYRDRADGLFGPRTEGAIATFQISEGLQGTGLPDPLTVWKLIRP